MPPFEMTDSSKRQFNAGNVLKKSKDKVCLKALYLLSTYLIIYYFYLILPQSDLGKITR